MEVLTKSFSQKGYSPPEAKRLLKEFRDKSMYINDFRLDTLKVYHITGFEGNYLQVISCNDAIRHFNACDFDLIKRKNIVQKDKLPIEIIEQIMNGTIKTVLIDERNQWFFLAESARSLINTKAKISGRNLYDGSLLADISFAIGLKGTTNSVLAVIRQDKGIRMLAACLSTRTTLIDLNTIPEWKEKSLAFVRCQVTDNLITLDFEGAMINDFIPVIRVAWSDTGCGLLKRYLCVKHKSAEPDTKLAILNELEESDTIEKVLEHFANIAAKKSGTILAPLSLLRSNLKEAGLSRLKKIEPSFSNLLDTKEFLTKCLEIPEQFGDINTTTDTAVAKGVGKIFMSA